MIIIIRIKPNHRPPHAKLCGQDWRGARLDSRIIKEIINNVYVCVYMYHNSNTNNNSNTHYNTNKTNNTNNTDGNKLARGTA